MLKLNLENAVKESAISKLEEKVKNIADKIEKLDVPGYKYLGWKDLPKNYDKIEFKEIKKTVKFLEKEVVDTLVVIGIGGSFAGAKAGIEMIMGKLNVNKKTEVIFAGESISSSDLAEKLDYVQNKNFAINVISKSGSTTEPAIAFRLFKKLLEDKVGIFNAKKYIFATTDANNGTLLKLARENEYKTFVIPNNIGGRFSVLSAVGLFPLAFAGVNIDKVMDGALIAHKKYSTQTLIKNDAYRYAAARFILSKKFQVELMVQYEPQMCAFSEWWKQLAGESEGKNDKGVFPGSAVFSTDLHSLGQFIQEGSKVLYETILTVAIPKKDLAIFYDEKNLDNLNYLQSKSVHQINEAVFNATMDAHTKVGKVPNIHIELEKMDEKNFGELVVFFERAVAMTALLLDVNPFNQPGVEVYKNNLFKTLKKPKDI